MMTDATLFQLLSFMPGPFWILVIFFPDKSWAMRSVDFFLLFLGVFFSAQMIPHLAALTPIIANPSLETIRPLFSSDRGIVMAWNHMIFADLWTGRWIALDTLKKGGLKARLVFVPIVLFFGPLGVSAYLVYRMITQRGASFAS